MVSLTFVLWCKVPLLPLRVSVNVPVPVPDCVVRVRVDMPEPVIVGGLYDCETFAGKPITLLSVTTPLKPFTAPMVTVKVVVPGRPTICVGGAAAIVKSALPVVVTTSCTVVGCIRLPDRPVR